MLLASFVFSCLNVIVRWLGDRYPVTEIAFLRSLFSLLPALVLVRMAGGTRILPSRRYALHVWRAAVGMGSTLLIYLAFLRMPLADAVAISFVSPLFLTALSARLLREPVAPHQWAAVLVGFAGVVLIVRPMGEVLNFGAVLATASAFLFALAMIAVRRLGQEEDPAAVVFHFALLSTLISAPLAPFGWATPTPADLGMLALLGIAGGIGQYFMAQAYRWAPAAVVGPFTYTTLLWASLSGFLLWGETPTPVLVAGTVLIVGSGFFMVLVETWGRRRAAPPAPARAARREARVCFAGRPAVAEGYIPGGSTGPEPAMTSHETVAARRTRHIRFNGLKDPEPVPRESSSIPGSTAARPRTP